MKPITLIIGGDLAPTKSNYSLFSEGDITKLVDSKLLSVIKSADYRIFNLELPLTDTEKPIIKDGPNNRAPVSTINGIKELNPTILGLSNNHIMDHDDQGLFRTMEILSDNMIGWVGVGKDLMEASKPAVIEQDNTKIGVYACAEHEFSIAGNNKAGASPFDPLESLDHIARLKSECDFVVILYHGGKELYRYPSPYLQKVCRKMVEKGADLVVCQHSHCVGAFENFRDGVIVYGQGNFLFDRTNNEFWQTSLLLKVILGEKMTVEYIPFSRKGTGIEIPETDKVEAIRAGFFKRSEEILQPGFIEAEFDNFCIDNGLFYLGAFAGFGRVLRKVDSLLHGILTRLIFSLKKMNMIQNFVECEAHRELFINYLRARRK